MKTSTVPDYPRGITFEQVWAGLMEDRKRSEKTQKALDVLIKKSEMQFKENEKQRKENEIQRKESERQRKEYQKDRKENERQRKESEMQRKENERQCKENEKQHKEINRRFGDVINRFGELAEHIIAPGIPRLFNKLGFNFDNVAPGGEKIIGEDDKVKAQVDLVLRNGEYIAAIEVKIKPNMGDISDHLKRLDILREFYNKRNDKRTLIGGIAGAIFPQNIKLKAQKAGLYVLVQSGDTIKMDLPDDFKPREWAGA